MTKKIALVTGGMGCIGNAICRSLHDSGYLVVSAYSRKHEEAKKWQAQEKAAGFDFHVAYGDVSDFHSSEVMIKKIKDELGPVDILINNAGIIHDALCARMKKEEWDSVINVDLNSLFYVTHSVLNDMKTRKFGRIINISSINGQKGAYGQVNYSAAKAGMHGFTKALAQEVAKDGITVNTISPGYVATAMVMAIPDSVRNKILADIPMGRFAEPEDVARVAVFLADEKNSYITGANIAINGGHYML